MQDLLEYLSQRIGEETQLFRRAQYRRDMVKAIIESYPPKTPITIREFAKAAGFKPQSSSVYVLVNRMLEDGEIKAFGGAGQRARGYAVLKAGNTYDEERGAEPAKPTPEELTKEGYVNPSKVYAQRLRRARESELLNNEIEEAKVEKTYTFEELEELAIRACFYAGQNLEVSQFLAGLKEE